MTCEMYAYFIFICFLDKTKFRFLWHTWMPHGRTIYYKATTKLSVFRQQDPVYLVPKAWAKLNLIELELRCYHPCTRTSGKTFSYQIHFVFGFVSAFKTRKSCLLGPVHGTSLILYRVFLNITKIIYFMVNFIYFLNLMR